MKVRIISALVGIVLLVGVMAIPSSLAVIILSALLAAVAVYELLYNTGIMKQKGLLAVSMAFSAVEILAYCLAHHMRSHPLLLEGTQRSIIGYLPVAVLGLYVLCLVLFVAIPAAKVTMEKAQYAFLLTLYATVGFGCVALLRMVMNIGWWLIVLLLVIAWMNDTGAYFVGVLFGKHKMAPRISPKKSWEGFFGGWVVSVLCAVVVFILRFEIENTFGENVFYTLYFLIPVAAVLAPLAVCGDLLASVIKRKCGIKDFGNIMPGHGGVMDRFDSVIFIAPLLYLIVDHYGEIRNWIVTLLG